MSDVAGTGSGVTNDVRPDASGGLLRAAVQQPTGQTDQIVAFVQRQPMTAALVALGIGYILGKIS